MLSELRKWEATEFIKKQQVIGVLTKTEVSQKRKIVNESQFESLQTCNAIKQSLGIAIIEDESKDLHLQPSQAKNLIKKLMSEKSEKLYRIQEIRQKEIRKQLKVRQDALKLEEEIERERKLQKQLKIEENLKKME